MPAAAVRPGGLRPDVADWLARRSWSRAAVPDLDTLVAARRGRTLAVVLPALDEEPTVGRLVGALLDSPVARLLDEVVVLDGGSRDRTADVARDAGARVVDATAVAPGFPPGGKGGSVWRALMVTDADLLVLLDADLDPVDPMWVAALAAPLLLDDDVQLVKASAERPLTVGGIEHPGSGGRVTELVARPLLNALWPELAGFAQPLSGELAARRSLLQRLPVTTGYGLEIGMLVDALQLVGLDALAQVDLGERRHRHQSDLALGRMASAVVRTALDRAGLPGLPDGLVQLTREPDGELRPVATTVPLEVLPPVASLG